MSRTTTIRRFVQPKLERLEDRFVLSINNAAFSVINNPLKMAIAVVHQMQAKLNSDLNTMRTDAGTSTFFSESMAQQTKNDQDYAQLMFDVAYIKALVLQIRNEAQAVISIVNQGGGFADPTLTTRAIKIAKQYRTNANAVLNAVFSTGPVAASPINGQPLAPQYPAFNTIPGITS